MIRLFSTALNKKTVIKKTSVNYTEVFSWCDREDSNLWPSGSENYDKVSLSDVETLILLVLHSCAQNKKKPVGGCHNRLLRHFVAPLHSSGQMVVRNIELNASQSQIYGKYFSSKY